MFSMTDANRFFLYPHPTDMRKSFYTLSDIERSIRCATAPQTPIAKSHVGSTVLANLMVGKYVDSLPFYRQIEMMNLLWMDIPPATVSDWFKDVADLLRPIYYRIRDLVIDTDYIQADDENLTYDERRDLRMRLAVPILQTFEVWLKNEAPKVLPKSP